MNLKHLLSDRFVEFSSKVADVHGRIKDLKAKFQAEMKALTDEAEGLNVEFEAWRKEQDAPAGERAQKVAREAMARNASRAESSTTSTSI